MIQELVDIVASHGDRGAIVPFSRIDDIKKDMLDLENGEFHTTWLDRMVNWTTADSNNFIPSDMGFQPQSLISVIMPSPKTMVHFSYHGKQIPCTIPPHYISWTSDFKEVLRYLREYLTPLGFSAEPIQTFPQKMLAVHCGLGRYGRNNICYHDEFGSYTQIMTYVSDMPCGETNWYPLSRMDSCDNCRACANACPTGAIDADRRLIDSDRCITFVNESSGDAFPAWLDTNMLNSLIGCVKCQDCCPGNVKNRRNIIIGTTFTEEETAELMNHKSGIPYSASLDVKIAAMDLLPEFLDALPRNLSVLLQNKR